MLRELNELKVHFEKFKQETVKTEKLLKAKNEALNKTLDDSMREIESNNLNVKKLNKVIKERDKKIHELEKVAIKVKEDNEREVKELKDFKVKTLQEKKLEEKQRKKQLKNNKGLDKCEVCERWNWTN